jgi:biopolymer transport protein ExbB
MTTTAEGTLIGRGSMLGNAPLTLPASPSMAVAAGGNFTFSAWVRPETLGAGQVVYVRRDGSAELIVGVDQGVPFVQVNGQRSGRGSPSRQVSGPTWQSRLMARP